MVTELILEKSIEDLTPALIAFNNEELIAYASRIEAKYAGRTYTDEQMKEAKDDRANIRRIITTLNDERIRIGKIYNMPLDVFKSKIDEVIGILKRTSTAIDEQVKAKDLADKTAKEAVLRAYYDEIIGDLAECIRYEQIADSRWLNATVSEKKAKAEMELRLEEINDSLAVIRALKSENESVLLALYFRTLDLTKALRENDRLEEEKQKVLEMQKRREEAAKAVENTSIMPICEVQKGEATAAVEEEKTAVEAVEKEFTVVLEVTGTPTVMKGLMEYIQKNGIKVVAKKN